MIGYYSKKCLCGKGGKWRFYIPENESYLCENHMIEWLSYKCKQILGITKITNGEGNSNG